MHGYVKERALFGRYISEEIWLSIITKLSSKFKVNTLGKSVESKPVFSVELGQGETKILLWSQMHGNESTSTKALFDLLNFFDKNSHSDLLQKFRFYIIPMLNPDGAFKYTRVNANKVDLNRDAKSLTQPESIILRNYFEQIRPSYCFNLHGQRTIFGTNSFANPATMSFLAPAADNYKTITDSRSKSMYVIGEVYKALNTIIPNHIGLYDDAYNANDKDAQAEARKDLAAAFRLKSKAVNMKYIAPPKSTDFAIVYVPTEGLFAELSSYRDPKTKELLLHELRTKYKVTITGPNSLSALLQSYHLGFATLKIQKHASQIYSDLRNISSRFDKHFDGIKDLRKKLEQAMTATDSFGRDARSIMNTLSNIKDPQQVKETLEENSQKIKVLK